MRGLGIGLKGMYDPLKATRQFGGGLSSTILSYNPIAYWPLNELSGTAAINYGSLGTAANGTYSGATLAQIAAPGGGLAPLFDGVNDGIDIYSVSLNGAFNGTLGTILQWVYNYNPLDVDLRVACSLRVDVNNRLVVYRDLPASPMNTSYYANGVAENYDWASLSGGWNFVALTWSDAGDEVKHYQNGVLKETDTSVETWAGALDSDRCVIGVAQWSLKNYPWYGYLSHAAIFNTVLTPEQIAAIYAAGGV